MTDGYPRMDGIEPQCYADVPESMQSRFVAALPDQWGARRREIDAMVRTVRKT